MSENVGEWAARLRLRDGQEVVWLVQPDAPGGTVAYLVTPGGLVPLPELGVPDGLENLEQIVMTLLATRRA